MEKTQKDIINSFVTDACFHMVKYENKNNVEFGKILKETDITMLDLEHHEIHRSIEYNNGNVLFVHSLLPKISDIHIDNPLQLLIKNIKQANVIELVYPDTFQWVFNGLNLCAYAIIPSGSTISNTTLTRYGGTRNFVKILNQHLTNIRTMEKGVSPNYDFSSNKEAINETEISIGSINMFNKLYSIPIDLRMGYKNILLRSKYCKVTDFNLKLLNMKYWAKEVNPDFINEAKHIKLKHSVSIDNGFDLYPPCVKNLMAIPKKGNLNRFKLARFLLNTHKPHEAKFVYDTVLTKEERDHIKNGNCNGQWNYIRNNLKLYNCPSCREMIPFCDKGCKFGHPLEPIQNKMEADEKKGEVNDK